MPDSKKKELSYAEPVEVKVRGGAGYLIYPEDSFDQLALRMKTLECAGCRVCVVTDSNVEKLYLQCVLDALRDACAGSY